MMLVLLIERSPTPGWVDWSIFRTFIGVELEGLPILMHTLTLKRVVPQNLTRLGGFRGFVGHHRPSPAGTTYNYP